jgi:hypothetical protein
LIVDLPLFKTARGESIVRFHGKHLQKLRLREPELSWSATDPDFLKYIETVAAPGASWTGMYRGEPRVCFGIRPVYKAVGEAWLIADKEIGRHALSLVRGGRKIFSDLLGDGGFRRIQIGVMADNDTALRFAKGLGFEVEGIMRNYGSPGASCVLMSRISDHGFST